MRRLRSSAPAIAIGLLAGVASFGHLVYPAWLAAKTRGRKDPEPPTPREWPGLTVVIPAYRERAVIADKVADTLANGYGGPLEVLVVADDADTAAAAKETGAEVIASENRGGKAAAVNRGLQHARHDLVVLTDANARLAPGTLAALARWFEDGTVGAVAGEKRVVEHGEGLYWTFESWLKRRETRLGSTIGLVGELAAVRKAACRPLPTDVVVDDLWLALDLHEAGHRVVYEPSALAAEGGSPTLAEEWERRTRNVAGALDAIWRRRELLVPGRTAVTSQLWGHRLVRMSLGPAAHAALLAVSLTNVRRSRLAAAFCLGHAVGAVALLRRARGARVTAPERVLAQVLFLQGVALWGAARWLRGDRSAIWRKGERTVVSANGTARAR